MNTIHLIVSGYFMANVFLTGYECGRVMYGESFATKVLATCLLMLFGVIIYILMILYELAISWYEQSAFKQLHDVYRTHTWVNPTESQMKHIDHIISLKRYTLNHYLMRIGAKEIKRRYEANKAAESRS